MRLILGPFTIEQWLDPVTRQKVVLVCGTEEVRSDPLSELQWARAKRIGWKVRHGGERQSGRDEKDPEGNP
jgi:hypothetical protein